MTGAATGGAAARRLLLTCPPMIGMVEAFRPLAAARGAEIVVPEFTQIVPEARLVEMVGGFDGWIIGDDPATRAVFEAGRAGRLRAAVKWGVGVDNVDFAACRDLGLPIANTPGVFGREVADMATGFVIALARRSFEIDRSVRAGGWAKPAGASLWARTAAVIGFGDIGRNIARRLLAADMAVIGYDPALDPAAPPEGVSVAPWPERIGEADFLVFAAPLTPGTRHLFDRALLERLKPGACVVNVGRGPVVSEAALVEGLASGRVAAAALDVFEVEPLPADSPLRGFGDRVIFSSHNGSNTVDAVRRVSTLALDTLLGFLDNAAS